MVDDYILQQIRKYMSTLKVAGRYDKVYKEECVYSFDSPYSEDGLFVNLTSHQGVGLEYLAIDHRRTGCFLYLLQKWTRVPLDEEEKAAATASAPAGSLVLDAPKLKIQKSHFLTLLDDIPTEFAVPSSADAASPSSPLEPQRKTETIVLATIPLPCPDLPMRVTEVLDSILSHDSAEQQDEVKVFEEERRISKYASSLPQLPAIRKISPSAAEWSCDDTGVSDNLWLNLSTGHIGSGRRNWDGTGGNGSALRHYEATGKLYPLVVKLGTITPHGADVYSYAAEEDDMVLDPKLAEHLRHWGIDVLQMEKTEKTVSELQLDLNKGYEFSRITEEGKVLRPLKGPLHVGLVNLGNSCYLNSVVQLLTAVPEIQARYAGLADRILEAAPGGGGVLDDLPSQLAKVAKALVLGRTGHSCLAARKTKKGGEKGEKEEKGERKEEKGEKKEEEKEENKKNNDKEEEEEEDERSNAVRPFALKQLLGKGHPEFSTGQQQDAGELWVYLLEKIEEAEAANSDRLRPAPNAQSVTLTPYSSAPSPPSPQSQSLSPLTLPTTFPSSGFDLRSTNTRQLFTIETEQRTQCSQSQAVSYRRDETTALVLQIPLEAAVNGNEVKEYQERKTKRQRLLAAEAKEVGTVDVSSSSSSLPSALPSPPSSPSSPPPPTEPVILPKVPLSACLEAFAAEQLLTDYASDILAGAKGPAVQTTRIRSFPPYLLVQLQRCFQDVDWRYKKLEALVDVPDSLDLEFLRSKGGPQADEILQPKAGSDGSAEAYRRPPPPAAPNSLLPSSLSPPSAPPPPVTPDEALVAQLLAFGFGENACRRAAAAVSNAGPEAAAEWLLLHIEDSDINDPLAGPVATAAATATVAAEEKEGEKNKEEESNDDDSKFFAIEKVLAIQDMGFSERQAKAALASVGGDLEAAANWLFSHMEDLDTAAEAALIDFDQRRRLQRQQQAASLSSPASASSASASTPTASVLVIPPSNLKPLGFDPSIPRYLTGYSSSSPSTMEGSTPLPQSSSKYELVGFVSHMGSNMACGHYVAHVLKDRRVFGGGVDQQKEEKEEEEKTQEEEKTEEGQPTGIKEGKRWVLFNDGKVAESQEPPKEYAYLYLYRRV